MISNIWLKIELSKIMYILQLCKIWMFTYERDVQK